MANEGSLQVRPAGPEGANRVLPSLVWEAQSSDKSFSMA